MGQGKLGQDMDGVTELMLAAAAGGFLVGVLVGFVATVMFVCCAFPKIEGDGE